MSHQPARKTARRPGRASAAAPVTRQDLAGPAGCGTPDASSTIDQVDTRYLETLVGYNVRRASLSIVSVFLERMAAYDLRPVDFSVLSLVGHNPGITSRQICSTLGLLPPNLVAMIGSLERRDLIQRERHAADGRAMSLFLTPAGKTLLGEAEVTAAQLEVEATQRLSDSERTQLMVLLRKIYQ